MSDVSDQSHPMFSPFTLGPEQQQLCTVNATSSAVQVNASTQATLYDCWTTCDVKKSCFSFTYTSSSGACKLYNSIGPIYPQTGTDYYAYDAATGPNCELLTFAPTPAPTTSPSANPTGTLTTSPSAAPTSFPGKVGRQGRKEPMRTSYLNIPYNTITLTILLSHLSNSSALRTLPSQG